MHTDSTRGGVPATRESPGVARVPDRGRIAERLAWHGFRYRIPGSANRLPYMLGGLTFASMLVLVGTGLYLDQYYNPSPLAAHDSVVYIITRAPLGSWVRALHYWSACAALVGVAAHLIHVFARRSYRRPRELTWWTGVALLLLLFALAFTGTVLRGDQEGGEALAHAVAGAELLGWLGGLLSPDFTRSTSLLGRMHSVHVSLLPILLFGAVALHFWLVRHHGVDATGPETYFTAHLRRLAGLGLLGVAFVSSLAVVAPPGLGYPAVDGVEVTKPFWPFLWIYTAENALGLWGMILTPAVLFGFLAAVPLLDRAGDDRSRPRWVTALAALVLAAFLVALVYGRYAPQMQHIGM